MRERKRILLLLMALALSALFMTKVAHGQERPTIVEALQAPKRGEGVITITQSPAIAAILGKPSTASEQITFVDGKARVQVYRVQLYSGSLTRSRSIAESRAREVKSRFPDLNVSLEFAAPFWRLRVGEFQDLADARECLYTLQEAFPSFAKEMYVVRATVTKYE